MLRFDVCVFSAYFISWDAYLSFSWMYFSQFETNLYTYGIYKLYIRLAIVSSGNKQISYYTMVH